MQVQEFRKSEFRNTMGNLSKNPIYSLWVSFRVNSCASMGSLAMTTFKSRSFNVAGYVIAAIILFLFLSTHTALADSAIDLLSHKAKYRMSLVSAKGSSLVIDVDGDLSFELRKVCNAWEGQQKFHMDVVNKDGSASDMTTLFTSWESMDGKIYHFNIQREAEGEVDKVLRGQAFQNRKGKLTAFFTKPENKKIELPSATLLPTRHTIELIRRMQSGDNIYSVPVFDGTESDGAGELSTLVISEGTKFHEKFIHKDGVEKSAVDNRHFWKIRMASYPPTQTSELPDYETEADLLENGVWDNILFDYGGFQVLAVLESLEVIPEIKCKH